MYLSINLVNENSYVPRSPDGLKIITSIKTIEYKSIRYFEKALKASGKIVSIIADKTEPVSQPIPPRTTITTYSVDFINPSPLAFKTVK